MVFIGTICTGGLAPKKMLAYVTLHDVVPQTSLEQWNTYRRQVTRDDMHAL
jgi:hypothetical protein